ncbi:MAG: hypothetical protein JXR48_13345 [Candidatus Delongbacteria bacterium]|nr:hypothetical protein [Candidatus Delongbacteria bacterium]MBN2835940.1 hypothetical protein [Candidatus Delongbacteria bacterium]
MEDKIKVGIDGGGTKTAVIVIDDNNIIHKRNFGPGNYLDTINFKNTLEEIIVYLNSFKSDDIILNAGFAAVLEQRHAKNEIKDRLNNRLKFDSQRINIYGDSEALINVFLNGNAGIIYISGTGSVCLGQNKNRKIFRSGGNGYLIDDFGSGYRFGRLYLKLIFENQIDNRTGYSKDEILKKIYTENPKKFISNWAPEFFDVIFKSAIANKYFHDEVSKVYSLFDRVIENLRGDYDKIVLHGSVISNQTIFSDLIKTKYKNIHINNESLELLLAKL